MIGERAAHPGGVPIQVLGVAALGRAEPNGLDQPLNLRVHP